MAAKKKKKQAATKKKAPTSTLVALVCAVSSKTAPTPRAPARVLDAGRGLFLVVHDVDAAVFGAGALEEHLKDIQWVSNIALEHERMIQSVLEQGTVLPIKVFTLFSNDDRAAAHVAVDRARLDRVVKRVGNGLEWTLRLRLDERAARQSLVQAARDDMKKAPSGGASFLVKKKHENDAKKKLTVDVRARADACFDALADRAVDVRRRTPEQQNAQTRLLIDASFLVDRAHEDAFLAVVDAHARDLKDAGFDVSCTGPWPLYSFVGDAP